MIVSVIDCLASFRPPTSEKLIFFSLNNFTLCNESGTVFSKTSVKIVLFNVASHPPIKIKIFLQLN